MSDFAQEVLTKLSQSEVPPLVRRGFGAGDAASYKMAFELWLSEIRPSLLAPLIAMNNVLNPFISIHFSSPFLRKWIQIIDERVLEEYGFGDVDQTKLAAEFFRSAYDNLPRISNFALNDDVINNTLAVFCRKHLQKQQLPVIDDSTLVLPIWNTEWKYCADFLKRDWFREYLQKGFPGVIGDDDLRKAESLVLKFGSLKICANETTLRDVIRKSYPEYEKQMLICMFMSTYYWTICLYSNTDLKQFWVLTIPVSYARKELGSERLGTVSYCWGVKTQVSLKVDQVNILMNNARSLVKTLLLIEQLEGQDTRWSVLKSEDVIRQSCYVSDEVLKQINRLPSWVRDGTRVKAAIMNAYYQKTFNEIGPDNEFLVASPTILELLDNIHSVVKDLRVPLINKLENKKVVIITLVSEPGTGKEKIAQLAHYMSLQDNPGFQQLSNDERLSLMSVLDDKDISNEPRSNVIQFPSGNPNTPGMIGNSVGVANYFVRMCSTFKTKENLREDLFGSKGARPRMGDVVAAHFLAGTVFLDEFNTMDPSLSDEFLRMFEKPYEVLTVNGDPLRLRRVLIIIASNQNPDQLRTAHFNPAVISRIEKYYWTVPPLRERPEDIAVFVNGYLTKYNKEHTKTKIERIEPNAMRLLTSSHWKDNYRELQSCIDFVINRRFRSGVKSATTLTFDEIVFAFQHKGMLIGSKQITN
jgi:hypothetical protein